MFLDNTHTHCSYQKCGERINREEDLTKCGDESYHRGCWLHLRLKSARETVSQLLPAALRLRMFHQLRGHNVD